MDPRILHMADESTSVGLAPPVRLEVLGADEQAPVNLAVDTTAVVVFHGVGQQVKFETLDLLAQALIEAHEAKGEKTAKRVRHVWCEDPDGGRFFPRVEVELQDASGNAKKHIHVYEAYWAPLTEGAISFLSTAAIFLRAGFRGICSSFRDDKKFLRWAFGKEREFPLAPATFLNLALATALLTLLVAALSVGAYWVWPAELRDSVSLQAVSRAGLSIAIAAGALYVIWKARQLIVQYLGDVAIYVSASELDKYWRIRDEIKRECGSQAPCIGRWRGTHSRSGNFSTERWSSRGIRSAR
jgi:hypothetical protein